MAGADAGFDSTAFRDGIHFAMHMGLPPDPSDQIKFYFAPTVTNPGSLVVDGANVPFDPDASLTATPVTPVQVDCAVEYFDAEGQPTSFGMLTPSRIAVTLLDVDYDQVDNATHVVIAGDRYNFRRTVPPQGLFDVGLFVMHFTAENET
jgi:hypothetical protein